MRKLFLLVLLIGFGAMQTFAQISDEEVVRIAKEANAQGKSKQEIALLLSSKGVTQEQAERIRDKYEGNGGEIGGTNNVQTTKQRINIAKTKRVAGSTPKVATSGGVFGRSMFTNNNLTFEPNLNIPTPDDYKLGAGDEILIDIWGISQMAVKQIISPEGNINVEKIGPIYLNGKSIKEANEYLKNKFSRIFSDLSSKNPKTFIKVSLGQIRSIRVNIMGEVVMPGTYTLPSLATLFHALYSAGGVNNLGTLRDVILYRGGKQIARVDMYEYILNGDNSGDIRLMDGDLVSIGTYKKIVSIQGNLKRPMRYEIKDGENLDKLIKYAGGFNSNAYRESLSLRRKGDKEYKIFTIYAKDFPKFELVDGDIINVESIIDRYENIVSISGSVYRPGEYAISDKLKTVKELIDIADGLKGDAFTNRAILYRLKEDYTREVISIDINKLMNGKISDINLKKYDDLYIMSKNLLRDSMTIQIRGEVRSPNTYSYVDNMTLEDAIVRADGLKESASEVRVDISRRIKRPKSVTEAEAEAEVFSFALKDGLVIDGIKGFVLQPFDEIYVRRSPGYRAQRNVSIKGQVIYPGTYAKTRVDWRISDLVKQAGGLTSLAYIKGSRLTRRLTETQRAKLNVAISIARNNTAGDSVSMNSLAIAERYNVGIDLVKALENPGSNYDIVLNEGDELIISEYDGTVKISGAVMYPNTVAYDEGMSFKDYVENAGGFAFRAKRNKGYVIYMNGTVKTRKWYRNPKIEPGCEIIIPLKPERRRRTSLAEIMSIANSTASIGALITTIVNMTK